MMYSSVNIEVCAEKCNHLISQSSPAVVSSGTSMVLYKLALTFTSVDETLVRDHSNESY